MQEVCASKGSCHKWWSHTVRRPDANWVLFRWSVSQVISQSRDHNIHHHLRHGRRRLCTPVSSVQPHTNCLEGAASIICTYLRRQGKRSTYYAQANPPAYAAHFRVALVRSTYLHFRQDLHARPALTSNHRNALVSRFRCTLSAYVEYARSKCPRIFPRLPYISSCLSVTHNQDIFAEPSFPSANRSPTLSGQQAVEAVDGTSWHHLLSRHNHWQAAQHSLWEKVPKMAVCVPWIVNVLLDLQAYVNRCNSSTRAIGTNDRQINSKSIWRDFIFTRRVTESLTNGK